MLRCRELRRGCQGNFQLNLFWFSGECRSGILRKKALGAHLNIYCVNPSLSLINSLPNLISIKFTLKSICLHSAYDLNVITLKYRRHSVRCSYRRTANLARMSRRHHCELHFNEGEKYLLSINRRFSFSSLAFHSLNLHQHIQHVKKVICFPLYWDINRNFFLVGLLIHWRLIFIAPRSEVYFNLLEEEPGSFRFVWVLCLATVSEIDLSTQCRF